MGYIMKISQEAVVQAFTLVGLVIIMFAMSWKLALFSLIPVPIVVVVGKMFSKVLGPKYMRLWRRHSAISTMLADSIPGVRVIKAFTNEKKTIDKFNRFCDEWFKEDKKVAIPAAIFPSIITFLVTCGSLVIWFLGGNLVIGDSVTTIGYYAFRDCTSLTSVEIPDSVTSIGDEAFSSCESLISIIIPNGVTSIGVDAFRICESLKSITIPASVKSIGGWAFDGCKSLTDIRFQGIIAQWEKIEKGYRMINHDKYGRFETQHTSDSVLQLIHCTDGDIKL